MHIFEIKMIRLLFLLFSAIVISSQTANAQSILNLPITQNGGTWDSGHVQGIAVDKKGGYIYYSFTNLLAKYDFEGKLIGTLIGWNGHLGDLDFNPDDGLVYGSLEYKKDNAFYIAVIDVDKINAVGINANETGILRTVYLKEVVEDYIADLNNDGIKATNDDGLKENQKPSQDHRYGCSGIDGVSFGPKIGHIDGKYYLTVAYGIYGDTFRNDNDHQVIVQYDTKEWKKYLSPLIEDAPHNNGPDKISGKYFIRTGNTTYGVQNLAYDDNLKLWFMGVYKGKKPIFPNYTLFAFDAKSQPLISDLVGVPSKSGKGWEKGLLLPLSDIGLYDDKSGIRGWNQKADVGLQPVGNGLFYLAVNSGGKGQQTADLTLMLWTSNNQQPFKPINFEELNKIKH
jgi:hypothetical protein